MHVALVGPYPLPGSPITGGVERVIDTLMRALSRHLRVSLIVPGASRNATAYVGGVEVHYLARGRLPGSLSYWTCDALKVRRLVGKLAPDVVHIQGAAGYGLFLGRPFTLTVHGIPHLDAAFMKAGTRAALISKLRSRVISTVERLARRIAGRIVVINPYVTDALPDVAQKRTAYIPNPVDPLAFAAPVRGPRTPGEMRLLAVGKLCRRKNSLGLIQLFASVASEHPHARLVLCGAAPEPDYLAQCEEAAAIAGVEHRIEFAGSLSMEQLIPEYDRASALLMLSNQETAPLVVAEAHLRGLPVFAPLQFGLSHMIRPGFNGVGLPTAPGVGQSLALAAALHQRFDAEAIRAAARNHYDVERIAGLTRAFYAENGNG